jgi:hypothetical protein
MTATTTPSELWDSPDSGLKEDFTGTIFEAEWVQGQRGGYSLQLKILADDEEVVQVNLGAGKDWVSYDGGESVKGPGPRAKFNERSGMWRWISAAVKAGAGDELKRRDRERFNGKGPLYAAVWLGLRFHFDVVKEPGDRPDEKGEWKPVEGGIPAIRPVKYLGSGEESEKETPKVETQKLTRTKRPAPTTTPSNGADISENDLEILKGLATRHNDYGQFADAVMETEDSAGVVFAKNRNVMMRLSREEWFEELRS